MSERSARKKEPKGGGEPAIAKVREGMSSAAAADSVELAADHSFPASDPPSWTGVHAGAVRPNDAEAREAPDRAHVSRRLAADARLPQGDRARAIRPCPKPPG